MEKENVTSYSKQVVESYKGSSVNWYPFLWYITQYVTIVDYDENTVTIHNRSSESFFRNIRRYGDDWGTHNYNVDKESTSFREYNRGYKYNSKILEQLWREPLVK